MVCINKYDLNEDNTHRIERYCLEKGLEIAGRISFNNAVTESIVRGIPVVEYTRDKVTHEIESLWRCVKQGVEG